VIAARASMDVAFRLFLYTRWIAAQIALNCSRNGGFQKLRFFVWENEKNVPILATDRPTDPFFKASRTRTKQSIGRGVAILEIFFTIFLIS